MMAQYKKIVVTGGGGFFGSHVVEWLLARGVPEDHIAVPRSRECDLRDFAACAVAVRDADLVIHLAAKVGGIGFNRERPGELFYDNLIMGAQLMEAARRANVKKFMAVATICAYPKYTTVPFREEDLWNGYPEETNAPYGIAKKMLLVQAQAYRAQYGFPAICLFPVNLYGPRDTFDSRRAHVIPALIRKIAEAKYRNIPFISVWGTGNVTREFLYIEDAAEGLVRAAEHYDKPDPVNLGSGNEISIRDLAVLLCKLMDYRGELRWDTSFPDGQPRRRLDVSRAEREFGFRATTPLETGLQRTVAWFYKEIFPKIIAAE